MLGCYSWEDRIDEEGLAIAERFASYQAHALQTLMKSLQLVDLDLNTYLDQAGTGFESIPVRM